MNEDRLQGLLTQYKGWIKQCWGTLTGDAHLVACGQRDWHDGHVAERCAIAQQQTERQFQQFLKRNRNGWLTTRR